LAKSNPFNLQQGLLAFVNRQHQQQQQQQQSMPTSTTMAESSTTAAQSTMHQQQILIDMDVADEDGTQKSHKSSSFGNASSSSSTRVGWQNTYTYTYIPIFMFYNFNNILFHKLGKVISRRVINM
jgi:hypothetical protein